MTRIFLYQRLRDLSAAETKATLAILTQLYDLSTTTSAEAFAFLQKQAEIGIVMRRL